MFTLASLSLHDVLWWLLAALIATLSAAILWSLVTPLSPVGAWRPVAARVPSAGERAALFASLDPFNRAARGATSAEEGGAVTSLSLTLFGTRSTPGGGGSAIIAGADGVQQAIRVGAEVQPGVTLAGVAFDHAVLARNGARELLYIDQSGPAPDAAGIVAANPVRDGRIARAEASSGPGALTVESARRGIGFGPRAEGGRIVGLEVMPSGDGQVFRAAGFQPGDLVTAVNGKPVTGAGDSALIAGALRPGASVAVTVKRGDRLLPLAITLAP